jgi:5-methylcytosine-specific restriction endonuclease McrA
MRFNSLNKLVGAELAARDFGWMCTYCYKILDPVIRYKDDGYGRLRPIQHDQMPCVDHVMPVTAGGPDHIDNYVLCCKSCNSRKGNRILGEV